MVNGEPVNDSVEMAVSSVPRPDGMGRPASQLPAGSYADFPSCRNESGLIPTAFSYQAYCQ